MDEAKRKSSETGPYNYGTGKVLSQVRALHQSDPGRFLRAKGKTGSDEEQEADLLFEVRRKAILDEARENGVSIDLSDCIAKDLSALEAKLAASPPQAPQKTETPVNAEQSEVTETFCQAHFARLVDLAQASPVTVTRQDKPVLVVLSAEQYAVLSASRAAAQPGFGTHLLGKIGAGDLTLTEAEVEDTFQDYMS